jgi:hypothetical protein
MARILLIRHGPSAHSLARGLLDRAGVAKWRAMYDAAGTADDASPPAGLFAKLSPATRIVASDWRMERPRPIRRRYRRLDPS